MVEKQQFSTFVVDNLFFGIEVEKVQEVLRYQEMTRVPLAPPVVQGLINLRGQIVTAIDLRRRMDLRARGETELPMNVVVRTNGGAVSLLVDDIGDVVDVEDSSFETPPDTLKSDIRALIRGVHKLQGRLMHVLETEKVLDLAEVTDGSVVSAS